MGSDNSSACPQTGLDKWVEDCLFASVFTTYLPTPQSSKSKKLRPVMLWLHGGGYTRGSGLDPNFLGGQLASRSDVVVVTPNYRLGYLGFASFNDTISGNWAIGDIVTALQWVKENIEAFGGDPGNVSVFGQSAGANLLIALLASPKAKGLFHAAIVQSGQPIDDYTARSTVSETAPTTIQNAARAGCTTSDTSNLDSLIECLRGLAPDAFFGVPAGRPLVDGKYLLDRELDVSTPGEATGYVNRVPLVMGYMRDEMGSLGVVPPLGLNLEPSLKDAGVTQQDTDTVVNNPDIFVVPDTPNGNQNLSV